MTKILSLDIYLLAQTIYIVPVGIAFVVVVVCSVVVIVVGRGVDVFTIINRGHWYQIAQLSTE